MAIIIGVGVVLDREESILLGQRRGGPWDGHWSLPGGKIETFESISVCAERELAEETGIVPISAPEIISVSTDIDRERSFHSVTFGVSVREFMGDVANREPDKFSLWNWTPLEELPQKLFLPTVSVLIAYFALLKRPFNRMLEGVAQDIQFFQNHLHE